MSTAVTTHQRPPLPPNCRSTEPYGMKYKTVLRPNPIPDVAIIYSANCSVSCEWMSYITNLMKSQGYKNVISQQVESFSGELPLILVSSRFRLVLLFEVGYLDFTTTFTPI